LTVIIFVNQGRIATVEAAVSSVLGRVWQKRQNSYVTNSLSNRNRFVI